jgi:PKD repeat protein
MRVTSRILSVLTAVALCAAVFGPLPMAAAEPGGPKLDHPLNGEAAIAALGPQLAAVAQSHGKTTAELAKMLRSDHTLWVDTKGKLFYREDAPAGADPSPAGAEPAGLEPLSNTFVLHSKPGSKRVIYLDFDGHTLQNTAWNGGSVPNPLVCPPWDTDGNASVFGDAERTVIQKVWQRVSEDYAPFDVDVTTEDPGDAAMNRDSSGDEYYGTRVLISPISSYFGSYGGIAYVGVFDSMGSTYKPALVFPERLSNGEKYIAEAAAHECGHNLGLSHDGTTSGTSYYAGHGSGETGWAPIMGSGYYKNLTQWSRGEYSLANNTEDDLAVIGQNGCVFRTDDYPNSAATAPRIGSGTSINASGLIANSGDVDVLSFAAGAGQLSLTVAPATLGPNLDIALELRDESNTLVASSNPANLLAGTISATVPAGTYFLSVRGTGNGDPLVTGYTSYASTGSWTLSGTVPMPSTSVPPVPVLNSSVSHGPAPLSVAFDGSGSYDPDGSVVSWAWDFGDGTSGSGSRPSHSYTQPGTYHVTMTIADNAGLTSNASADVIVETANAAPVASFWSSANSGYAPLTITLDGSGSSDPDGSIVSWAWAFGDGTSGSGPVVDHIYSAAGTYLAVLTVTDDLGATGTSQMTVRVTPAPTVSLRVESITLSTISVRNGKSVTASIRIVDSNGLPVPGAAVTGVWTGAVSGTTSAVTGADGVALATSKSSKKSGAATFTVTRVSKTGYTYDPSQNLMSKASIALAERIRSRALK